MLHALHGVELVGKFVALLDLSNIGIGALVCLHTCIGLNARASRRGPKLL